MSRNKLFEMMGKINPDFNQKLPVGTKVLALIKVNGIPEIMSGNIYWHREGGLYNIELEDKSKVECRQVYDIENCNEEDGVFMVPVEKG